MQKCFRHWLDVAKSTVKCGMFTVGFYLKTDTNCSVYTFKQKIDCI